MQGLLTIPLSSRSRTNEMEGGEDGEELGLASPLKHASQHLSGPTSP